jgi:hypothetical protein
MAISNSVPLRWPSGPLEIAVRQKKEGFTPQARQTLESWHRPSALDILEGSPVNCLVVSWAAGVAEDAEQQRTLRPLVDAARQRKIDVIGWVEGDADSKAAIAAAQAAGLAAVAIPNFTGKSDFPVIPYGDRAHAPWDTTAEVLISTDNVWPGVAGRGSAASAGPTAVPWLDSNGWFIQLARARAKAPVWVMFDPPGKGEVVPARSYPLAVCDAEKAGGRWVITLDDALRASLAAKEAAASTTLKSIWDAVSFFDKHREWKSYQSLGLLGVISDYKGDNYEFSGEILNLSSRRDLLYRVLYNDGKTLPNLAGLKALTWADPTPPSAALRKALLGFVQQGGMLVTGAKWGSEGTATKIEHPRFDLRTLGKGRLAVSKDDLTDPWTFVGDVEVLLSHKSDLAKLFNASASGGFQYGASPDGKKGLLQLLQYSTGARTTNNATAWTRHKYRKAQVWGIESAQPKAVEPVACEDGGTEYHMPPMSSYTAVEFEI